jgi:tetratricopeptide (TPR) repeat protein
MRDTASNLCYDDRLVSQVSVPPLNFSLYFVEGRGRLSLSEPARVGLFDLVRLELEIPEIHVPADASGEVSRLKTRRCNLVALEVEVDEQRFATWLGAESALERYGVAAFSVRFEGGLLTFAGRIRVGDREAPFLVKALLGQNGRRLQLIVSDVHLFSYLPIPAPLVGHILGVALGAKPLDSQESLQGPRATSFWAHGGDQFELDALELVLERTLLPNGWRLPRTRSTLLEGVHLEKGRLLLRYGTGATIRDLLQPMRAQVDVTREGDELMLSGNFEAALSAYVAAETHIQPKDGAFVDPGPVSLRAALKERQLAILAAISSRFGEAEFLAMEGLDQFPDRPFARLALGAVAAERGKEREAARHFAAAHQLFSQRGELEPAVLSAMRAAELFAIGSPDDSLALIRKVLELAPDHPQAGTLLARLRVPAPSGTDSSNERAHLEQLHASEENGEGGPSAVATAGPGGSSPAEERAESLRKTIPLLPLDETAHLDEELLELDPTCEEAHERVLARLRKQGDPRILIQQLESRLPLVAPHRRAAWALELGQLCQKAGEAQRALRAFGLALEAEPSALAAAAVSRAARELGSLMEGADAIESALTASRLPADQVLKLRIARGDLLLSADHDVEAETEFVGVLAALKRPDWTEESGPAGAAHAGLADLYQRRGDLIGALEHRIAAAESPDLEPARAAACALAAADVLMTEGDSATAERLYLIATALQPADRQPIEALCRLAAARGDHERRAEFLERWVALTTEPHERARLLFEWAQLCESELGRDLDAYRLYQEAITCDPNLVDAVRAFDRMAIVPDDAGSPEHEPELEYDRLRILLSREPGPRRLALLRRLLALAVRLQHDDEVDSLSEKILTLAPDDLDAFIERRRLCERRSAPSAVVALLRMRAQVAGDEERVELLYEAGQLAETIYDLSGAVGDYEAALQTNSDHVQSLEALADLTYRTRQPARARALYAQLGDRTSRLEADEIARRRAELAEEADDLDEAQLLYAKAVAENSSNLPASQGLARLALRRGDDRFAYSQLKRVLALLPLDEVERITELRRRLGQLAIQIGEVQEARGYLELVSAHDGGRADVLELLSELYASSGEWQKAASLLGRRAALAKTAVEKAALLYQQGEALRIGVGDLDHANDLFLKAADLHPTHPPTLRRLVSYYYQEGEFAAVGEVARELESLQAPLEGAALEAGLGIALGGDETRGTMIVTATQASAESLAESLARVRVSRASDLDAGLRAATRALGGGEAGREHLAKAFEALLGHGLESSAAPKQSGDEFVARICLDRLSGLAY